MKLLADENIDLEIIDVLRKEGHQVLAVVEMKPGIGDQHVFDAANQEGAILLTSDKDFGEIVFRQRKISGGVILARLAGLSALKKASLVSLAICKHSEEMPNAFSVISPGAVRIRNTLEAH